MYLSDYMLLYLKLAIFKAITDFFISFQNLFKLNHIISETHLLLLKMSIFLTEAFLSSMCYNFINVQNRTDTAWLADTRPHTHQALHFNVRSTSVLSLWLSLPLLQTFFLQSMSKWQYYKKHKSNWNVDCGDFNRQIIFRQKIPFKNCPWEHERLFSFHMNFNFEMWLCINYLNYYFSMIINIIQIHNFLLGHYSTVQGLQFHVRLCKQMQIIPKRIFVQLWNKHELPKNSQQ